VVERPNYFLRLIRWLDNRGARSLTRWFCFIEGVRHPSQPSQFIIGLNNARPGSWLEKVYAREVFRFNHVQNCIQAYHTLRRHGIDPRPHGNPEVNIVLMSLEREVRPAPEALVLPKAENLAHPLRNPGIKLFEGAPPAEAAAAPVKPPMPASSPQPQEAAQASRKPTAPLARQRPAWLQTVWTRLWRFIEIH